MTEVEETKSEQNEADKTPSGESKELKGKQQNEMITIPIEEVMARFKKHLNLEGNAKIFFSAPFGMGKTYFLKKFFEKHVDEYEVFHLFPVNYQIYENHDILDLLKYDILTELDLKDDVSTAKENRKKLISVLKLYWKDNSQKIISSLIEGIPKLGKPMSKIYEVISDFQIYSSELEGGKLKDEDGALKNFMKEIKSVDEVDLISQIIKKGVEDKKEKKKSILILDDLDRLDPNHVFRILNIFSAYFDREEENKFGFDKVIVVGDYENIEKLFEHKHSKDFDSSGYLDKFHSTEPYFFENKKFVKGHVTQILQKTIEKQIPKNSTHELAPHVNEINCFLSYFINHAIEAEAINLRELLKGAKRSLLVFEGNRFNYSRSNFAEHKAVIFIRIVLLILIEVFSGPNNFIKAVKKIGNKIVSEGRDRNNFADFYLVGILESFGYSKNTEYNEKNQLVRVGEFAFHNGLFLIRNEKWNERPMEEVFYEVLVKYMEAENYTQEGYENFLKDNYKKLQ